MNSSNNINPYVIDTRYMINCEILKNNILEINNKINWYREKNQSPPMGLMFNVYSGICPIYRTNQNSVYASSTMYFDTY